MSMYANPEDKLASAYEMQNTGVDIFRANIR